jgi:hypothetical protein
MNGGKYNTDVENVEVRLSNIPNAGNGLFAVKN